MVRIDDFRLYIANKAFDNLYDFEQRHSIKPVVRKVVQRHLLNSHLGRSRTRLTSESRQLGCLSRCPPCMSRSQALPQDGKAHIVALSCEPGDSSAAAENFIIRMSSHDQNPPRRGHGSSPPS